MITLINPSFFELYKACVEHVPEYFEHTRHQSPATITLHDYPFSSRYQDNRFEVEIKCRGNGCKMNEVIGRGEADTLEEAAMIALLEANGVKVKYFNDK